MCSQLSSAFFFARQSSESVARCKTTKLTFLTIPAARKQATGRFRVSFFVMQMNSYHEDGNPGSLSRLFSLPDPE